MEKESINEHVVSAQSSSIALLQERFRQLERMKEMREERELLRKRESSSSGLLLFHLLMTAPRPRSSTPTGHVPNLSLGSSDSMSHAAAPSSGTLGCMNMEATLFALLPKVTGTPSSTSLHVDLDRFRDSDYCDDVDTSLHL